MHIGRARSSICTEGYIYSDSSRRHRLVLADQTAEDIDAVHPRHDADELAVGHARRSAEVKAAVRSLPVVVLRVGASAGRDAADRG